MSSTRSSAGTTLDFGRTPTRSVSRGAARGLAEINRISAGLAWMRVLVGAIFAAHGAQKLFVFGFAGVSGAFGSMGVPLPGFTGPAVALVEFFGGLALVFGLLTRLAAFGLAVVMLGAIMTVHLPQGFFLPNGAEYALALFAVAVTLALTGPGAYSLDDVLARRRSSK